MIEEYLQIIVENRKDQHYLLEAFPREGLLAIGISDEMLTSYENTFMELDIDCKGTLGIFEF